MTGFTFAPATQEQTKLRLGLVGPAGSGKTFTALRLAVAMGKKVALIDTERGSASKYANLFTFDTLQLTNFNPQNYVGALKAAEDGGYDVAIIDSLSHAWMGEGGALQMVDNAAKRSQSGNSFAAWRDVTPIHNQLVDAMLGCNCHLIVTMRTKTEYVLEKDERTGKTTPRKIGMAPIQRDGMEYEFDVVGDMDQQNNLLVSKTRCPDLNGAVVNKPGEDFAKTLLAWLGQGIAPQPKAPDPAPDEPTVTAESDLVWKRFTIVRDEARTLLPDQVLQTLGVALGLELPKSKATLIEAGSAIKAALDAAKQTGVAKVAV